MCAQPMIEHCPTTAPGRQTGLVVVALVDVVVVVVVFLVVVVVVVIIVEREEDDDPSFQHSDAEMAVGSVVPDSRTGRNRDSRRNPLIPSNTLAREFDWAKLWSLQSLPSWDTCSTHLASRKNGESPHSGASCENNLQHQHTRGVGHPWARPISRQQLHGRRRSEQSIRFAAINDEREAIYLLFGEEKRQARRRVVR